MKLTRKSSVAALLTLTMGLGLFSGCERGKVAEDAKTVVAKYGNEKIYLDEARFYAQLSQYQYEEQYAMAAYWKTELSSGYTYEDSVKDDAMSKVLQTRILCEQADALGVSLDEADTAKIAEAVEAFLASEEGIAIGAAEELVNRIYTQNALANKVQQELIADTDRDVEEDQFACRDMDCIVVYPSETEEGEEDTVDEAAAAEEIQAAMEDGDAVDDIYDQYDSDVYSMYKFNEYAVCLNEEYPFVETLFDLEKEGDVVTYHDEENDRYYVIRLTALTDEDATKDAIAKEISDRESENFNTKYEELKSKAKSFKVNEDVWAAVTFEEALYVAPVDSDETQAEEETTAETVSETETETVSETETDEETETAKETETEEETEAASETETDEETESAEETK